MKYEAVKESSSSSLGEIGRNGGQRQVQSQKHKAGKSGGYGAMEGPNKGSNTKHGWHGTRTYQCWNAMIMRCSRTGKEWHRYGGRGITVCQRWRNFVHFLEDMGTKPDGMMLERINNDGNYEPSNCRWATRKEQCRNRSQNLMITHNGITLCSADWSFKLGGKTRTLVRDRIKRYGWSSERAVTTPVSVFVRTIHNAET